MRTTVRLSDRLLTAAKKAAVERHVSLTRLIEEALEEKLYASSRISRDDFRLVTFNGNGIQPGVDLDDSAALLERMGE